jgi:hypothetical protein
MSSLSGLSAEELRAAVRAVLREVLPADVVTDPGTRSHDVTIASEADLTAFVRRVAAMCEDDQVRAAMQDGRHGFRLSGGGGFEARKLAPQPPNNGQLAPRPPGVTRVERGAVTERAVVKAAAEGARLVLGRGAVLTPLARDKARSLGVEIEKEH